MKCFSCGATKFSETAVSLDFGVKARAWKCAKCGELVLEPQAAEKALLFNKLKKGAQVRVGVLGSSTFMRFPAEVSRLLGLHKGSRVLARPKVAQGRFLLEVEAV
mgnify:CR=1 FL=1